jgi:hypothetical protein
MPSRTYLPGFAQLLHKAGKYAFAHKAKLIEVIDGSEKLTEEEKGIAKKAIEDVLTAHTVFQKIWHSYGNTWHKSDWVP